ncbi:DUF2971 domain-containing protein [Candidatus Woesearchaeota archaeon]|nr:DUF2971 domain-containing protein [Candidatus Woesearchaeota archaeon]
MTDITIHDIDLESGKYLFKFCCFNTNSLQILINNTLYFSSPQTLNDPLDSRFKVEINNPKNFSEETRKMIRESWFYNDEISYKLKDANLLLADIDHQKSFFSFLIGYLQDVYSGICCFSQKIEDNLLWAHYADEARGLCFVFDKEKLFNSIAKNINRKLYLLRKDSIDYRGVGSANITLLENGEIEYTTKHLFSKTNHWSHEKEYRVICEIKEGNKFFPLAPVEFNRFKIFDEECLKYVVLGERMRREHAEMVMNICKSRSVEIEVLQHTFNL